MVHRNYIHTFIAILIISMLSLHTMAYSHHSNDSIATTAIDANESSKSKVRRIGPKENLSATPAAGDTLSIVQANDSLPFVAVDSATISQTTQAPKVKTESALDAVVDFTAQDSLVFEAGNLATYEDGDLVSNVTLSVYRREYDGSYTEIASGIPNDYTSVTDPHPALDYARYRFVAKDVNTGAISFWDMGGYPVNGHAVIIQWAEEWSTFDLGESTATEGPSWSGSLLMLPYNIKITNKRKREVTLVDYVGREHPVSYYGTQLGETAQWSMEIPADDKETIYALNRLSIWSGDVYVREPSGVGFWANVEVSFNQSYDDVKIPISLDITRVEGGV